MGLLLFQFDANLDSTYNLVFLLAFNLNIKWRLHAVVGEENNAVVDEEKK